MHNLDSSRHGFQRDKISNFIPIESFKSAVGMKDPKLSVKSVSKLSRGIYHVRITAHNSAAYVWIETPYQGHWSDNGFMWLLEKPDTKEERSLLFHSADAESGVTEDELKESLKLRSLWETADY